MKLTEEDKQLARKGFETLNDDVLRTREQKAKESEVETTKIKSVRKSATLAKSLSTLRRSPRRLERTVRVSQKGLRSAQKTELVTLSLGDLKIELPQSVVEPLTQTLKYLAEGKEVSVTAQPEEFTTQQAADFLRVSRPYLVGLLDKGEIPSRKVGTHRRVLLADLTAYKERIDAERLKVLDELTAQAQELKMGY